MTLTVAPISTTIEQAVFVDKETPMRDLLATLRVHLATRTLALTTFCDACGEVCTPACRLTSCARRPIAGCRRSA